MHASVVVLQVRPELADQVSEGGLGQLKDINPLLIVPVLLHQALPPVWAGAEAQRQ